MSTIRDDARIDPRIKQVFGAFPAPVNPGDAASRDQLVEEANSEEAAAMRQRWDAFLERCDTEEIAPSGGLAITTRKLASEPDGNTISIRFIRPAGDEVVPCVYYIHGGGMQSGSFLQGNYRAWVKIIAARGVAVAMVDFRNALTPSSVPEIGPFPAYAEHLRDMPDSWSPAVRRPLPARHSRRESSGSPAARRWCARPASRSRSAACRCDWRRESACRWRPPSWSTVRPPTSATAA